MTEKELLELIRKGEGQTLEFKDDRVHPRSFAETLAAFAAANGGVVLIGVADDGTIQGVSQFERVRDNLIYEAAGRSHCEPQIQPIEVERIETHDGKIVVAVTVPADFETLHSVAGKYVLRVGSRNEPLTPRELRRLMFSRGEVSFERLACERVNLWDLDQKRMTRYILKHEEHSGRPLNLSQGEFLLNLGCATRKEKEIIPTHAGVLLFHEEPQLYFLQSQLLCARFKGTDVIEYLDRKEFRGPLPELVDQATRFIKSHMRIGGRIPGIQRVDYPEYPEVAFREAIINAVIHRDWSLEGEFIRVFMFDDRIEVMSPGRLLPPITIEAMQKGEVESRLRNPVIVEVLDRLGGYIEKLGTGIRRMIDAMKEHDLEPPRFELQGDLLKVILRGPFERFMAQETMPEWAKGLNERQTKAIDYAQAHGKIANKEYRTLNHVSHKTAHQDLTDLCKRGILKVEGKGKATQYVAGRVMIR
ncbi:putative DNA binding domain-containing protein [Candidatus Peregrinibacteria bacterium]|nr:putative DNA binding domain-containing protein [Candidatus Peregrinibacteria bacterium]